MDTQSIEGQQTRTRRLPRVLTMAALVCFALPFLTVTCYGDATVSGVQAATGIDLDPNDDRGEAELVREEDPNAFVLVALAAAIAGLALAFGSSRSRGLPRKLMVWTSAVGAFALAGFFGYAFYRSWGGVWPRVGFVGALMCFVGAAWAGVGHIPRWVGVVTAGAAASMIPGTLIGTEDLADAAWLSLPAYAGVFLAVTLAVGAIRASARAPEPGSPRPSTLRIASAGVTGVVGVAAAGVGSFFLMAAMVSGNYGPDEAGRSYLFAIGMLVVTIAASELVWIAGRAIAHGRSRVTFTPIRAEVNVSQ
jgi:hypothetical protein